MSNLLRSACVTFCLLAAANLYAETRKQTALSYVELGDKFAVNGDYARAACAYNIALQFDPKLAVAYFARAYVQQALGKFAEAIADYSKTLEIVPECAEAYSHRGYV